MRMGQTTLIKNMMKFRRIVFGLVLFVLCKFVDGANDSSKYCDLEKYCTANGSGRSTLHIGCPENYNKSKSNYKVLKLKYNERTFIINELNQFRSDVALGEIYANKLSSSTFSYMKKLKWNYELDHLLQLMITKHSSKNFYCMSTYDDHKPIQLVISVNRPQPFSLEKVFSLAIDELKSKALQSYSLAGRNEIINWSQCYHPETSAFACAVGEINSALNSNDKNILIRCAFYGKKFTKSKDAFKYGELCSECGIDGCSDLFPGLCGSEIEQRRGKEGPPGSPGIVGQPGLTGAKGEQGAKGELGTDGKIGSPGERGTVGLKGYEGIPGPNGAKGKKGIAGIPAKPEDCPGLPGTNGANGLKGLDGPTGAIGEAGAKGEAANQIIGKPGALGLSIQGERGDNGDKGEIGLPGHIGEGGLWGDEGDSAFVIDVRFGGIDNCVTCTPGLQGLPGPPGPQGPQGPAAESHNITETLDITTQPNRPDWYN